MLPSPEDVVNETKILRYELDPYKLCIKETMAMEELKAFHEHTRYWIYWSFQSSIQAKITFFYLD